jgi:ABC-type transport system involved in Fe-S cluster assembly fused permease/ATPase subunit
VGTTVSVQLEATYQMNKIVYKNETVQKYVEMTENRGSTEQNHWKTLRTLGSHLWPKDKKHLRWRVIVAVLFLIGAKILNVYVPFLLKQAIDALSVQQGLVVLPVALIVSYGLARLLVSLFGELRDLIFVRVAQNAQRTIALGTFKHLHNLSLDFHLARQTGGLSRVIERGTRGIQFVLNFMTFNIVPTLFEIALVTGVVIYYFNVIYAGIIFLTILLYIALTLVVTEWRLKYRRAMNSSESKANTKAIDSLINYETVKYFGNEEHEYSRFDHSLERYESAAIKSQWSLSALNVIQSSVIGAGLIAIMLMAGQAVVEGEHTIGDFVLVNSYLIQLYMPLNFLGFVYREIKNSLVDMDKMFELVHVHASVADREDARDCEAAHGEVEFDSVCFSYNQDRKILKNVSFKIPSGRTLAVVGPSGSGKSTLARLLFRFYDVNEGAIKVDGRDIRSLKQKSLRSRIGVVPQDTVLFNDTVGYNIAYGQPGATQSEIEAAARMAKIHDFIASLPQGYDTPVGERGLKLSGGEKQRVAIARTILKNPNIMIFDEATSALDSHKEKEIQASLKEISANRSTLVIAHRLSTIIDADEIIVLKNGEVAERGKHQELLKQNGEYADLWNKQQEAQEYKRRLDQIEQVEKAH